MKRNVYLLSVLTVLPLLAGCMGYQLGNRQLADITTVSLAPVINQTDEPAIELQVTHAMREQIQFDGRLKLVDDPGTADGVIEIVLTRYDLTPIAYGDEKRTTPQLYRMRITGTALLKRTGSDEIAATSETYGEATLPFQSDLTSAKRDALPTAAVEIATYMVDDLIEQW